MTFDSIDWGEGRKDAWLYGVVIGWSNTLSNICIKHTLDEERLIRLNKVIRKLL